MRALRPSWLMVGLLLLGSSPALADRGFDDLSMEQLMDVDVETASYLFADRLAQPVSLTTISREQIERSGARTLNELLLEYVPGFFLVEDHDDTIAAFRGFSPDNNSKVLLLVDGHNLNTEWFMGPPDALLNGLDLAWIDHVEVIRGPGSVTLGQGALLGVINLVTRRPDAGSGADVTATLGVDGYRQLTGRTSFVEPERELSGELYVGETRYRGQELEARGWAVAAVDSGNPASRGHRLKRGQAFVLSSRLGWKELELRLLRVDHQRDNYNFYRDREEHRQSVTSLTLGWDHRLDGTHRLQVQGFFDQDDFGYLSHSGMVMAGTREERVGGRLVWLADGLFPGNRLAVGVEAKQFRMGLRDAEGANFISNQLADRGNVTNQRNTYVNRSDLESGGLFVEAGQELGRRVVLFAGLRLDVHSYWGAALSPRAGVLVTPEQGLVLRLSYQSGFRGAPGVHYVGGWRRDGLLHESNFDDIDDNPAVADQIDDFPATEPERSHTFELGVDYAAHPALAVAGVAYVGWVENVIDVFAIDLGSVDDVPVDQQTIGSDPIGDWGGWFLFKNNAGRIVSSGAELAVTGRLPHVEATLSYSAAIVLDAPDEQIGTMYVSGSPGDLHFKAYPEHVLRLNLLAHPCERCSVALNGLFFSPWYPPSYTAGTPERGEAGLVVNASAAYRFSRLELALSVKNLLDANPLWPMNSNIGSGLQVSPGTPALEDRTGWVSLRASL